VVVRVVVMMTVSLTVGRMYWVQNALALSWYSERERMTASVIHTLARVAMIVSRTNEAGKCMAAKKVLRKMYFNTKYSSRALLKEQCYTEKGAL
jgi:hypothetical protein